MRDCPLCGVPVHVARTSDGTALLLDAHESPAGDARYRVVEYGRPWLVEPIDTAHRSGYSDHRVSCPRVSARERLAVVHGALGQG